MEAVRTEAKVLLLCRAHTAANKKIFPQQFAFIWSKSNMKENIILIVADCPYLCDILYRNQWHLILFTLNTIFKLMTALNCQCWQITMV